ncbi:MAG: FAD-dependent oxidoreductase [Deltaproteobacteria bacterium]|nr:MAG: FAD-dependent oxidoreductase [Deltaproteobacteria bacterium]
MIAPVLESEVIVIGAGVVGLAVAAELARGGREVTVLEREGGIGRGTSSRNSGVMHGGLYYPPKSLKAATCVEGRELSYARASKWGVAHRKTGKLIVAVSEDEVPSLEAIARRAGEAGVHLEHLDGAQLRKRDPALSGVAALYSPESGIIDVHGLIESYRAEARQHGAEVVLHTRVVGIDPANDGLVVATENDRGEGEELRGRWVINAAGLDADHVAALAGLDIDALGYRLAPSKGDYFVLSSEAPRPRTALVYPVPAGPGLGVHLTIDLGGRCVAGPDATFVEDRGSYGIDENKAVAFAEAVARYLPGVRREHLTPDYAGIRPRLAGPGMPFRDFVIEEATPHGAPGLVNLLGIESPGLTAAPAIAMRVAALIL